MKQLHPLDLWVVELPEGATDVEIHNEAKPYLTYKIGSGTEDFDILRESLPVGFEYDFHFTTQTATEQDWAGVLPSVKDKIFFEDWYVDYKRGYYPFDSSIDSGHSLLTANGLPVEKNYAILGLKK